MPYRQYGVPQAEKEAMQAEAANPTKPRRGRPPGSTDKRGTYIRNTSGLMQGHTQKPEYIAMQEAKKAAMAANLQTREGILAVLRDIAADPTEGKTLEAIKLILATSADEATKPPASVVEWINAEYEREMQRTGAKRCDACQQYIEVA